MPRAPHSSPQTLRLFDALLGDHAAWRYGYDLSRQTGLASGTLYPILMRLQEQGLLEAAWEPSDQPGKPPRHTYRLTGDGRALAEERLATAAAKERAEQRLAGPAGQGRLAATTGNERAQGRGVAGKGWGGRGAPNAGQA